MIVGSHSNSTTAPPESSIAMTVTTSSQSGPESTGTAPDSTSAVKRANSVFPTALRSGQSLIQVGIFPIAIGFDDSLDGGRRNPDGGLWRAALSPATSTTCC